MILLLSEIGVFVRADLESRAVVPAQAADKHDEERQACAWIVNICIVLVVLYNFTRTAFSGLTDGSRDEHLVKPVLSQVDLEAFLILLDGHSALQGHLGVGQHLVHSHRDHFMSKKGKIRRKELYEYSVATRVHVFVLCTYTVSPLKLLQVLTWTVGGGAGEALGPAVVRRGQLVLQTVDDFEFPVSRTDVLYVWC